MAGPGPVACFSYLAAAELWRVTSFPVANHGAEVMSAEHSVAADGPMAAAVLTALGTPAVLLSNDTGNDAGGAEVRAWLRRYGVASTAGVRRGGRTPRIVVVADDRGTRTWFASLPGIAADLAGLDLAPLLTAAFAYIDCYQLIETPAIRAIDTGRQAGVPLLVNLGGSPLAAAGEALRGYPRLVIQTNVDDDEVAGARGLARSLLAATGAAWVVVTAGAAGATAVSTTRELAVRAFGARVRHAHCAGAAFSGGLIYGLLRDWPMGDCLTLACASGALRCERAHAEPMPALDDLLAFTSSQGRIIMPAA